MMTLLKNAAASMVVVALAITPIATGVSILSADVAYAGGKGRERSSDRGSDRGSDSRQDRSTARSAYTTSATRSNGANAQGMQMRTQALANQPAAAPQVSSLAPTSSPLPHHRPSNRGVFAADWKSLNALWASATAFENAGGDSRLGLILAYYTENSAALEAFQVMIERRDELEDQYSTDSDGIDALIDELDVSPFENADALSDLGELAQLYADIEVASSTLGQGLGDASAPNASPDGEAFEALVAALLDQLGGV